MAEESGRTPEIDDTVSIVADDADAYSAARVGPCLFLLLECGRPLAGSARHELSDLDAVTIGRAATRHHARLRREDGMRMLRLGVPDRQMSQSHARLVLELGRWVLEDAGSKNGVVINGIRHDRAALCDGDVFDLGHTIFLFRSVVEYGGAGPDLDASRLPAGPFGLATFVSPLGRTFEDLARIVSARRGTAVLLQGKTGTGKEVVARAIHELSGRPGPFVGVNCGALPATLVEGELFGCRKGAFTGATEDREGLVRSADKGTLFLDEIGELPLASQAALLRVLEERKVTPIGGTRPIDVDLQLVAATHRDLRALIAAGRFRQDLYARIAEFVVRLPTLRDRREDVGLLIAALLEQAVEETLVPAPTLSIEAGRALVRHGWPLNIRGLAHTLGIALTLASGGTLGLAHLRELDALEEAPTPTSEPSASAGAGAEPVPIAGASASASANANASAEPGMHRKAELEVLLRELRGNVSAIARRMRVSRVQVHRWAQRYGFELPKYR